MILLLSLISCYCFVTIKDLCIHVFAGFPYGQSSELADDLLSLKPKNEINIV